MGGGRKKTFACGHRGKGQYCHRCHAKAKANDAAARARAGWQQTLDTAPIPLGHLPRKQAEKTLAILESIGNGVSHTRFNGKRLSNMNQREIISIPIGRQYRLICRDDNEGLCPIEALSHEDYNQRLASGGWK